MCVCVCVCMCVCARACVCVCVCVRVCVNTQVVQYLMHEQQPSGHLTLPMSKFGTM